MRNVLRIFFLLSIMVLLAQPLHAASATYNSIARGVDAVTGHGESEINTGRFTGKFQNYDFTLINRRAHHLVYDFDYRGGGVESATAWFREAPVTIVVRQNDLCIVAEVRKIVIRSGGFLDPGASEFKPINNNECRTPTPRLLNVAAQLFTLPYQPNDLFAFKIFAWQDSTRRCRTDDCAQRSSASFANFFKDVRFFPRAGQPGLAASLSERTQIALGAGDYLVAANDAKVVFRNVRYLVAEQRIEARLTTLQLPLVSGLLTTPTARLSMEQGSLFRADGLDIAGATGDISITGGILTGTAASGSNITISNGDGVRPSVITFARATVELGNIDLRFSSAGVDFSAANGKFDAAVSTADLQIGRSTRLFLGAADILVTFRCPQGSPADCRPISAKRGAPLVSMGEINPMNLATQSGSHEIPNAGIIRLDRGELRTGILTFNSRNRSAPIVGNITRIHAAVSAQALRLDEGFVAQALSGDLQGEDLTLSPNDGLPVGELRLRANLSDFTAEGMGRFALVQGSATMTGLLRRADRADVHLVEGRIEARANLTSSGGNAVANLVISDLSLVRGNGTARLTISVPTLNYSRMFPGRRDTEDFVVGKVEAHVKDQNLVVNLTEPMGFENRLVRIRSGRWSLETTTFPIRTAVSISDAELVYAKLEPPVGGPICTAKVHLNSASFQGNLNATVAVREGRFSFATGPLGLSPFPVATPDGKACRQAISVICGLIGGALLGPFGLIGAAYLCHEEVREGEKELEARMNEMIAGGVRSIRFDVNP
ncbi:hypothetical protein ACJ4V0_19495 [Phreatobacter sp. HK31-P]